MMQTYQKISLSNIINFANPRSFVASVIPALFGIVISYRLGYNLGALTSISILISCMFFQASVNTFNDYSDFVNGVDSIEDNLEKNDNIMGYYNINPKSVEKLACIFLLVAIGFGLFCLKTFNIYSLLIGLIGALTVLTYSNGPIPLSYLPVGEFVSGLVMGFLIPLGVYTLKAGQINHNILIYTLPLIIGISMIMMTNNGSDIEKDYRANRYTLAVKLGRENFKILYKISIIFWLLSTLVLTYYLAGRLLFIASLIIYILIGNLIKDLLSSSLMQIDRICQMKKIALANLLVNGTYILAVAISLLV